MTETYALRCDLGWSLRCPIALLYDEYTIRTMMMKRLAISVLCVLTLSANADESQANVNEQLSDAYIRSALAFMTYAEAIDSGEPQVLAGVLLDAAVELAPGNAQAWAMRAELAQAVGDIEIYEKALVGYLDTGVDDDRARFNLIRQRLLRKHSTLDAQLREVEKLLSGEAGRSLSGPLRSQLASLASALAGELLNEGGRRRWAIEAARADPTNLTAAQTMLALVVELGGDALRQGTAMINIVRADPLDPSARLTLAEMLAEQGAYERAAQQYHVVSTRLSPQPLHINDYSRWAQCLAMSGQDELLLQLLQEFEAALNEKPTQPTSADGGQKAKTDQQPDQEPTALPLELELIRLAVLRDSEDQDDAQVVYDRIAEQLRATAKQGDENTKPSEIKQHLAWIAAVFGPNLDQADQAAKEAGDDPVALGWVALRRGHASRAREWFKPHADENPLAASGLALATGTDDAGRARLIQRFIDSSSTASLAALAAGRQLVQLQTPIQPTTAGKALVALMAKFPESFWLVDPERTPWVNMRMKIKPQRIKAMQPVKAEITLWNTSRFPLAISEEGPLNPRAVVLLNATSSGRLVPPSPPIVIDLGRRFSLKAGERMIIETRLDYHQFGSLRASNLGAALSFDAKLILNPKLTSYGTWRPGIVGAVTEERDNLIESRPATSKSIDMWLVNLESNVASERLDAIRRITALDRNAQPKLFNEQRVAQLTEVVMALWDNANETERAWMLLNAVALESDESTYPALLGRALQSKSKLVWYVLIGTHAMELDSSILKTAIGRQDLPEVSRFAERHRRLLRDYAKFVEEQDADKP